MATKVDELDERFKSHRDKVKITECLTKCIRLLSFKSHRDKVKMLYIQFKFVQKMLRTKLKLKSPITDLPPLKVSNPIGTKLK